MNRIVLGIRIHPEKGISYTGIEEANSALTNGRRVASVSPGDVHLEKISEENGKSQFALAGGSIILILEN